MMQVFGLKPTFLNFVLTTLILGAILVTIHGITGCTFISTGDNAVVCYDKDTTVNGNEADVRIPLIP